MKNLCISLLAVSMLLVVNNASYCAQWVNTFTGDGWAIVYDIKQTSDGGYIATGRMDNGMIYDSKIWVLKLNASGAVSWEEIYPAAANSEQAYSIQQTSDGGYIMISVTSDFGAGGSDILVLKLDSSGDIIWQKAYGDNQYEWAYSIQQTSDGGYIVAGSTDTVSSRNDILVLKLDSSGDIIWQKAYGKLDTDTSHSIQQTSDGGYILLGQTYSFSDGLPDSWVLKLDSSGNIIWQKAYEKVDLVAIQQTRDGGYVLGGINGFGDSDVAILVLKLDSNGNIIWQNNYGGGSEIPLSPPSLQQTSDDGYILALMYFVLKLDSSGEITWQKTYEEAEFRSTIQQTSDGGYILAGAAFPLGLYDFGARVLKLDRNGEIPSCNLMGTSNLQKISNPSIIVTNTAGSPKEISITASDTNISPQDITSPMEQVCYYEDSDSDGDGVPDNEDNCPDYNNPNQADADIDSIGDVCDNCPNHHNFNQADADGDGIGNVCDASGAQVPTLSEWGLIIFMTIVMGIGVIMLYRRREI